MARVAEAFHGDMKALKAAGIRQYERGLARAKCKKY